MAKQAGLWIDHREALIVLISNGTEEIRHIPSGTAKNGQQTESSPGNKEFTKLDKTERQQQNQIIKFYDEVIDTLREADTVQIFGTGEARIEFRKRMEHHKLANHIQCVETMEKMTDKQFAALVRDRFKV